MRGHALTWETAIGEQRAAPPGQAPALAGAAGGNTNKLTISTLPDAGQARETTHKRPAWSSKSATLFASATSTTPTLTTCAAILSGIREGRWREAVERIRLTFRETRERLDVEAATRAIATLKCALPAVIFAGEFGSRTAKALKRHSMLMVLDFDHLGSAVASTKALLARNAHVLAVFVSPSGDGLKIIVPVEAHDAATHTACFRQAEQYFADEYGLNVDPAGKDVSRLCFVSYDSELIMRAEAEAFGPQADVEQKAEPSRSPHDDQPNPADIRAALDCLPPDADYRTWLVVGMALHAAGEPVQTWDSWSARGQKYKTGECAAKWRTFHQGAVGPGTLFFFAKRHGWRPTPDAAPSVRVQGTPPAPSAWAEPQPISALGEPPPPWPWEVYPEALREVGQAIAGTMNVPDELPGLALLCAASIAARNVARVEIKRDHRQYPNVFGMAAVPVYCGKTPVARIVLAPLLAYQKANAALHADEMNRWNAQARAAGAQIKGIEHRIQSGKGDADALAVDLAELQRVELQKPTAPVFVVNDATPEAMARIMAANGGRLGVFSSEARQVLSIARGRYSNQGQDVQLWLAGHGGDYLRYDRAGSDKSAFELHHPVLSAFLATQPDSLRTLGGSAEMRESGFLARWLYVVPEASGAGEYPTASIAPEILERYADAITRLLEMQHATTEDGEPIPHLVRLVPRAFALWKKSHDATRRDAVHAPPLLAQCLGKLPEHLARIALVFHLVEVDAGAMPSAITEAEIERAHVLGKALRAHIARAVALMGETTERNQARELWPVLDGHRAKLREMRAAEGLGEIEAVKPRDVARFCWAGIEDSADAWAALNVLETKGWLRAATVRNVKQAPAHELFHLYPTRRA